MRFFKILIIMLALSHINAFAKNSLEIGIFVPLGIGVGINQYSLTNENPTQQQETNFNNIVKKENRKSGVGFDSGVLLNIGYRFNINRDMSFSLLGEIGYSHDEFSFFRGDDNNKNTSVFMFESIVFGIYPKLNWKKLSFGLAGGVKVPLYVRSVSSYYNYTKNEIDRNIENYNAFQVKNIFNLPIIPYIKFSVDYTIYTDKKINFVLGGYVGYDFGVSLKTPLLNNQNANLTKLMKQNISSFDIGFQVGIKILPNY